MLCTEGWIGHRFIPGCYSSEPLFEKLRDGSGYEKINILEDMNRKCRKYNKRLVLSTTAMGCHDYLNWYPKDCGGFSYEDLKTS